MEVLTTKQELMLVDVVLKFVKGERLYVGYRISKFLVRLSGPY